MGRPTKANSLTRQAVIAAAIACLEQEGEAALGVNRVARQLGIKPPAIYKHLNGNAELRRAVVLTAWQRYLRDCRQQIAEVTDPAGVTDPVALFRISAHATRNFARSHPHLYRVMMQYQLRPTDPEEAALIQEALHLFQQTLRLEHFSPAALIDTMRMINAAIYGFILREQSDLMTLDRSPDASYDVMLTALWVAIEHIRSRSADMFE